MSKFDHNFKMSEADAIAYVREKLPDFFPKGELVCREIGDGNINYVYRVCTPDTTRSLIVKHAEPTTRSSGNAASTDRNRIEAEILALERELSPSNVPEVYLYDPVMCCVVMQDIGDHENLRYALIAHKTFPTLSSDIASFMAQTLIRTADPVLPVAQKRAWICKFTNPAMCDITERLVLTDPYKDPRGHNRLFPENAGFLRKELYEDPALHLQAAQLKLLFQSKHQSLIHGDLHSGSIFVKPGSTMVLDPEFACYGPAGYDVGNVLAHLIFAWANAQVTMADAAQRTAFQNWVEETMADTLERFTAESLEILEKDASDPMFRTQGFARWYLADLLRDSAGFAGTELLRRVIGSAKVKDLECISDPQARVLAERICVYAGKALILERTTGFFHGSDYVAAVHNALKRAEATMEEGI